MARDAYITLPPACGCITVLVVQRPMNAFARACTAPSPGAPGQADTSNRMYSLRLRVQVSVFDNVGMFWNSSVCLINVCPGVSRVGDMTHLDFLQQFLSHDILEYYLRLGRDGVLPFWQGFVLFESLFDTGRMEPICLNQEAASTWKLTEPLHCRHTNLHT